jgi:hypothetical protein
LTPGQPSRGNYPDWECQPRGPVGHLGPEGLVGPDAAGAVDFLESELSDVSDRVDVLESDLSDLQEESGGSTLESDVKDVEDRIASICEQLTYPHTLS